MTTSSVEGPHGQPGPRGNHAAVIEVDGGSAATGMMVLTNNVLQVYNDVSWVNV